MQENQQEINDASPDSGMLRASEELNIPEELQMELNSRVREFRPSYVARRSRPFRHGTLKNGTLIRLRNESEVLHYYSQFNLVNR